MHWIRSSICTAVVITAVALTTAACGSSGSSAPFTVPTSGWTSSNGSFTPPASLVSEAKKEGTLTVYTGLTTGSQVSAAFTKQYGIKVKTQVFTASQLESAFSSQSAAHQYTADVVASAYDDFYPQSLSSGYFNPIDKEIPGFSSAYPSKYLLDNGQVPVGIILLTPIAYNSKLVSASQVPTSYAQLAEPKWKGKLISVSPSTNPLLPELYALIGKKYGVNVEKGIGGNTKRYYSTNATELQALAAGEGSIAISGVIPIVAGLASSGAPVAVKNFDYETGAAFSEMASAHAPHPAAAALFLAWIYSKAGEMTQDKLLAASAPLDPTGLPSQTVIAPPSTPQVLADTENILGISS